MLFLSSTQINSDAVLKYTLISLLDFAMFERRRLCHRYADAFWTPLYADASS